MGRIARAWHMAKQSYRTLMQDKELLLLPLISGICIVVIMASFVFGSGVLGYDEAAFESQSNQIKMGILVFLFYVVAYTITFFFQAALIAGVLERMRGGNPTVGSALRAASKRFGALFAWGVVAGTVGMLLRATRRRSGFVGRLVTSLLGAAWSLATFFVVPILVMERQSIGASFKDSARMFKETWGETVTSGIGFGLLGFLLSLPVMLIGFLLQQVNPIAAAVVVVLGFCAIGIFMSALQGAFVATLYRFARDKETPLGFGEGELAKVFA